jgi:RNA polymerase sigma factor (sigma-70 family)
MLAAELQRLAFQSIDQLAPDDELLRRFAESRDEAAFAELVRRHGSLVLGVGRRILGDHHASEDILQATFLLLSKKADQIRWQRTIAPWLYSAAYRIAKKSQRRRRALAPLPESIPESPGKTATDPAQPLLWKEVQSAIDEELAWMSEGLRAPLVLCYLQGRTRDEAAQSLSLTLATLKRRLERGRNVLRARLTRRGITLAAAGAAIALDDRVLLSASAHEIANTVIRGKVPSAAASLLNGTFSAWKKIIAVSVAAIFGIGAGLLMTATPQEEPRQLVDLGPEKPPPATVDVSRDSLPDGAIARLGTTRLRPGARIPAAAFSPDGKQLAYWATGWGDRSHDRLIIADSSDGRELKSIPAGPSNIVSLQWLADGRGFALMQTDFAEYFLWEFTAPNSQPQVSDRAILYSRAVNQIVAAATSPDGRWLATGQMSLDGKERPIELWEVKANSRLSDLKSTVLGKHPGHCLFLAFSHDGKLLFVLSSLDPIPDAPSMGAVMPVPVGHKCRLFVYEIPSGKELSAFDVASPTEFIIGSEKPPERMVISPDAKFVLIGDTNGTVHAYDWAVKKEGSSFFAHGAGDPNRYERPGVNAIALSPDGQTLYTSARYSSFAIRDAKTGKVSKSISTTEKGQGKYFVLSPDGKKLADVDSMTQSWTEMRDAQSGEKLFELPGATGGMGELAILPDGNALTAGRDGLMRCWNLENGRELKERSIEVPLSIRTWSTFTSDGRGMFDVKDHRIVYIDFASGKQSIVKEHIAQPWNEIYGVAGNSIFVATKDNKLEQWDSRTGTVRRTFDLPPNGSKSPFGHVQAMSPDEKLAVTISQNWVQEKNVGYWMGGRLSIYDVNNGKLRRQWHSTEARFECAEFSSDARFLAVGVSAFSPRPHENDQETLPISPKSGLLLFDAQTGEPIRGYEPAIPEPHGSNQVRTVAISPNSQFIADVREGNSIDIHELATGEVCRHFRGHHNQVTRMAFTADSRRLVSVSDDSTGLVWDVSYAKLAIPSNGDRESLWQDLTRPEWVVAGPALASFATKPAVLLAMVGERMPAADQPDVPEGAIGRWIEQLAVPQFDARRKAQAELARVGRAVLPMLREKMKSMPGDGKTEREKLFHKACKSELEKLIHEIAERPCPPEQLRPRRVIALLSEINSPDSLNELRRLAAGHLGAELTRDAKAALKRLEK